MLQRLNKGLISLTGFELRRAARPIASPVIKKRGGKASTVGDTATRTPFRPPADPQTDRLLRNPVFIMSPVRSGSTLLRALLNAHSRLHSPHELHFRRLEVAIGTRLGAKSMDQLELERSDLEHLLWDRVMHRELVKSGKDVIVEKTPSNAFAYRRLAAAWPDARFIFLVRHPASIAKSWHEANPKKRDADAAAADALRYMRAVERAKNDLPGHTVRYEDLTTDPQATLTDLCAFLDIEFEPAMLEYGKATSGDYVKGLGDWKDKIRSGTVKPGRALPGPAEIPESLREISAQWGYLDADRAATTSPAVAHAEVTRVWAKDGEIRVTGEITGAPVQGDASEWRLLTELAGNHEHNREFPVTREGVTFSATMRAEELLPPGDADDACWEVRLVAPDGARLRLARHLDGLETKSDIMVYPVQTVTRDDRSATVRPLYTPDNEFSVECVSSRRSETRAT